MRPIFADTRIGNNPIVDPGAAGRLARACASQIDVQHTYWVPQDAAGYIDLGRVGTNIVSATEVVRPDATAARAALAHVRFATQLESLREMLLWVQCHQTTAHKAAVSINVYLIGGFMQAEPATSIERLITGNWLGRGAWEGVNEVYAHLRKPNPENADNADALGHIPAFVAHIRRSNSYCRLGTSDIAGCVAVLAVPSDAQVQIEKVHIYDRNQTIVQGAALLHNNRLGKVGFP